MIKDQEDIPHDTFIEAPIIALSHPLNPLIGINNVTERQTINILTYNLFLRPPFVKNNEDDYKEERLKEFIKLLPDYDILCLQEMFGFLNKRKHKLIRCATKAGFLYYTDSPSPSFFNSFVVDGGLLVLSRFPIIATEFKPFPYGIFSDSLAQKGVLYNKIQVKDEVIHIYGTHTQASYFGENQRYPILTRSDQFYLFRQFIMSTLQKYNYKNGELVLLMGDFNVDSRKPFIETEKIAAYPGFKLYPHLGRTEHFNEYDAMVTFLSDNFKDPIEDLLLINHGEHPITYADSTLNEQKELIPLETALTHKDDFCSNQSLDYIFKLTPKSLLKKKTEESERSEEGEFQMREGKLRVIEGSAKVEKFFITSPLGDFTQLSDHYGATVTLEYQYASGENARKLVFARNDDESQTSFDQVIINIQ